ncbi:hypothetical protein ONS95_012017 [Cadophora gregata]|uniref:uncharacterized protein n=1 Tax=Cadophora gregata TaxID=51156 RepID=UPI0026DAEC9A|nr:uncharacterized protein ONS95_012017 [Cadophora gregata]KAK0117688.1 hypothetical protein ONS95_012017 [Cadophora gregata]KAK0122737.1 hypothetical protein ONS96_009772 [Cadophora gregata f. sp. sojae]
MTHNCTLASFLYDEFTLVTVWFEPFRDYTTHPPYRPSDPLAYRLFPIFWAMSYTIVLVIFILRAKFIFNVGMATKMARMSPSERDAWIGRWSEVEYAGTADTERADGEKMNTEKREDRDMV